MDNRNNGRDCRNYDEDEFGNMNKKNCTRSQADECDHDRLAEAL